jgi:hypothetical protein
MSNKIAVRFTVVDFMNGTPIPVDAWATVRPNHIGVDGKARPYRVDFNKKTEDGYIWTTWDLLPEDVQILDLSKESY